MLYLEDYLEMIENLPMEMRDRFTEMREMDLQVQNAMDSLEDRVKVFFKKCVATPSPKPEWKTEQVDEIKQEYNKALEDADEKVQIANQMHELVERHLRKLDQEVSKFKMELEADNAGITEVLEKRSLELDRPPQSFNNHRAEKRRYIHSMSHVAEKKLCTKDKVFSSQTHDLVPDSLSSHRQGSAPSSPSGSMFDSSSSSSRTPALAYSLGQVGAGSNAAINLAASRAIGATLGMQQGRRTASLKASYEAVSKKRGDLNKELSLPKDSGMTGNPGSSRTDTPTSVASTGSTTKTPRTTKKARADKQQKAQQLLQEQQAVAAAAAASQESQRVETVAEVPLDENGATGQWQSDPNEPRYCTCNDVSYGEMVGCDNEDCPIEWFHYGCVGLTQAPKGKWFCPQCLAAMKRRGRK